MTVRVGETGAYVYGVMWCGSVWHCPACAAKIAAARREEVRRAVDRHRGAGSDVFMAAFTVPM